MVRALVVAVALSLAGCGGGQTPSQQFGKQDADQIRQAVADFTAAYNAKDVEKIAALFSGTAAIMPPNRSTLRGVDLVKGYYQGRLNEEGATDLVFDELTIVGEGNLAYVSSTYQLNLRPEGAPEQRYRGKNLWILRKLADKWRFELQMFSSDLPAAPPPAPAAVPEKK